MTITYKIFNNPQTKESMSVIKSDGLSFSAIPMSEDNTDYQAFLKYQAEGGVVLPADDNEQTA